MVISKSKVLAGIKAGLYTGYDDPKLVFLQALRKRGIQPQAIRNYILNLGISETETTVDLEILFSENRKLIDKIADRYMAVVEPISIDISEPVKKTGLKTAEIKYHPEKIQTRKISVGNKILISKCDFDSLKGKEIRLIDLFNVKLNKKSTIVKNQEVTFDLKKIQWVGEDSISLKIVTPEGRLNGIGEIGLGNLKPGDIIQLLRIGFCRVDSVGKKNITVYFSHK